MVRWTQIRFTIANFSKFLSESHKLEEINFQCWNFCNTHVIQSIPLFRMHFYLSDCIALIQMKFSTVIKQHSYVRIRNMFSRIHCTDEKMFHVSYCNWNIVWVYIELSVVWNLAGNSFYVDMWYRHAIITVTLFSDVTASSLLE